MHSEMKTAQGVQEDFLGEKSLGENRGRWDADFRSPLLRFHAFLGDVGGPLT